MGACSISLKHGILPFQPPGTGKVNRLYAVPLRKRHKNNRGRGGTLKTELRENICNDKRTELRRIPPVQGKSGNSPHGSSSHAHIPHFRSWLHTTTASHPCASSANPPNRIRERVFRKANENPGPQKSHDFKILNHNRMGIREDL